MAIELECGICGQEHRFREEHAGRQTRCKECTARIDIPRGGLGGILDGTTPVFTPPVILVGGFVLGALFLVVVWEIVGTAGRANVPSPTIAQSAPTPSVPAHSTGAQPSLPSVVPVTPSLPSPSPPPSVAQRPVTSPPFSPNISAVSPSARATNPRTEERDFIRKEYERLGHPLVVFETSGAHSVQIQSITPSWAEPGQTVTLRGKGLAKTNRVLAVDNIVFREHELTVRVVSDSELEVSSPPECFRRSESVFVFEIYSPEGVAVTLPRELADASDKVEREFAIVRKTRINIVERSFALVDDVGAVSIISMARLYLLKPTLLQSFRGTATKVFRTDQSATGQLSGSGLEYVTVPAIFPCHVDRMFFGPACRTWRLVLP